MQAKAVLEADVAADAAAVVEAETAIASEAVVGSEEAGEGEETVRADAVVWQRKRRLKQRKKLRRSGGADR